MLQVGVGSPWIWVAGNELSVTGFCGETALAISYQLRVTRLCITKLDRADSTRRAISNITI